MFHAQEYFASGYFSFRSRLCDSIKANIKFYAIFGVVAVAALVWIILSGTVSIDELPSVLAIVANIYGIAFIALLAGYGIVEIPRQLWRQSKPRDLLRRAEFQAPEVDGRAFEARAELEDILNEIRSLEAKLPAESTSGGVAGSPQVAELRRCLNLILQTSTTEGAVASGNEISVNPQESGAHTGGSGVMTSLSTSIKGIFGSSSSSSSSSGGSVGATAPRAASPAVSAARGRTPTRTPSTTASLRADEITIHHLAALHRRLILARAAHQKAEWQWVKLVETSAELDRIITGPGVPPPPTSTAAMAMGMGRLRTMWAYVRWFWDARVKIPAYKFFAILSVLLGLVIVWCESTLWLRLIPDYSSNVSPIAVSLYFSDTDVERHTIAVIPLAYLSFCVYFAIFRLRMFALFELTGDRQTDAYALMFNAMLVCRLQFSIGLNFINLCLWQKGSGEDDYAPKTAFWYSVGKQMKISAVDDLVPLGILGFGLLTFFNLYERLMQRFGYDQAGAPQPGNPEHDQIITEGRALLARGRSALERRRWGFQDGSGGGGAGGLAAASAGGGAGTFGPGTRISDKAASIMGRPVGTPLGGEGGIGGGGGGGLGQPRIGGGGAVLSSGPAPVTGVVRSNMSSFLSGDTAPAARPLIGSDSSGWR